MREVVSKALDLALLEICQLVALVLKIYAIGGVYLNNGKSDEDLCKLPVLFEFSFCNYFNYFLKKHLIYSVLKIVKVIC